MRVGIPREVYPGECRVAGTPRTVKRMVQAGFEVWVETGAGAGAGHTDQAYVEGACTIVDDVRKIWAECDIILKVRPPQMHPVLHEHEADLIREGATLLGFIWPAQNGEVVEKLRVRKVSTIALDCVPRITRAQKVDALSAMANAAGYRAVVEATQHYHRFLAGQVTAAGSVPPAKVLVIGAGVAGLAAIGTARGLGATVRAFDTREAALEQIQSMGAEPLRVDIKEDAEGGGGYAKQMSDAFLEAEMKLFAKQAMEVDIIITTALIPGKPAPKLITAGMVESMRQGSVIVDLAAPQGGNCVLTRPGEVYKHKNVTIVGYEDFPSRMSLQASWLYSSVLVNMLEEMGGAEHFHVDMENEVVRGSLVTHDGMLTWPPPKPAPKPAPAPEAPEKVGVSEQAWQEVPHGKEKPGEKDKKAGAAKAKSSKGWLWMSLAALAMIGVGIGAPASFLSHFTVFVLAIFVGWQVVWNVTPALHTPLMSVTNAISGIIVIGGMLHLGGQVNAEGETVLGWAAILGVIAVFVAAINISGGFLVTRRMLAMFQK